MRLQGIGIAVLVGVFLVVATAGAWEPEGSVEPEALTWLKEECPPDFLRSRTQFTPRSAERLVRRLYDCGALDVTVARLLGDFAGFRVFLPCNPEKRSALFKVLNQKLSACSMALVKDTGQEHVMLWFCKP